MDFCAGLAELKYFTSASDHIICSHTRSGILDYTSFSPIYILYLPLYTLCNIKNVYSFTFLNIYWKYKEEYAIYETQTTLKTQIKKNLRDDYITISFKRFIWIIF